MDLPIKMTSPWEATAPGWNHHRLDGDADAELAIVGAGITGLAAALRAAESGKSVIVLDAAYPGWGASGRNGGQVIPGLKADPDEIVARGAARSGLTWYYAHPPVVGLEYEMDVRGLPVERVI